jgi:hypothetical protein
LFVAGGYFLAIAVRGIGRRLHLYERGIIVSRGRRCEVYQYDSVVSATIEQAVPEDAPPYPHVARLDFRDGRHVKVKHPSVVPVIQSHVSDRVRNP